MQPAQIGGATLYLGDCREIVTGLKADMIFTDPPYGHNNNGDLISKREQALGKGVSPEDEYRPIANDGAAEAQELAEWLFNTAPDVLAQGGCCCCCCCGGGPDPQSELARHFIRLHTLPGETVLDPFMGGGSTAEAALKEGRKFIGVEIDPQWFDKTVARLETVQREPDLFIDRPKPEQVGMEL